MNIIEHTFEVLHVAITTAIEETACKVSSIFYVDSSNIFARYWVVFNPLYSLKKKDYIRMYLVIKTDFSALYLD